MITLKAKVSKKGEIKLPRLAAFKGKTVNVVISGEDEFFDLVKASETSFGFWENEADDEAWNTA